VVHQPGRLGAVQVCELGARADTELAVDAGEVQLDGLGADEERRCGSTRLRAGRKAGRVLLVAARPCRTSSRRSAAPTAAGSRLSAACRYRPAMADTPVLQGPRVRLRRVEAADLPALVTIRAEPGVQRWWGEPEDDDFEPFGDEGDQLVIEVDGAVAGLLQYEEVDVPKYRSAGLDVFLGAAWQGRGLGREAIGLLVRHLVEDRGHHRLTIDPAAHNAAAIRCYESVGFRRVGVMRQYERDDDGSWHDGLLLDLLADEWRALQTGEPG
jgi:aminoglycoside 6'-N-acetyltransferase